MKGGDGGRTRETSATRWNRLRPLAWSVFISGAPDDGFQSSRAIGVLVRPSGCRSWYEMTM